MTDLSNSIIYEDEHVLVINKPAGLIVHLVKDAGTPASHGTGSDGSVSEWFVEKYPESKNVGEKQGGVERPGIVHRIDRETSGVLLLAKTEEGHEALKKQFQDRQVGKIYHAFVHGLVKHDRGTIDMPIARSKSDFRKRVALTRKDLLKRNLSGQERPLDSLNKTRDNTARGKEAITYFEVLKRSEQERVTLVEAKPKTGRTHQIRVHFKALQHPVVADPLYAPSKPGMLGFKRLALHAKSIKFKNIKGEEVLVEAEYPKDFNKAVGAIDPVRGKSPQGD